MTHRDRGVRFRFLISRRMRVTNHCMGRAGVGLLSAVVTKVDKSTLDRQSSLSTFPPAILLKRR
jgi:hypothetical protein